jgi:hypothetical protein
MGETDDGENGASGGAPAPTVLTVDPRDPATTATELDAAIHVALGRPGKHAVITAIDAGGYLIRAFGPDEALPVPAVISVDSPDALVLSVNGGQRIYVSSDPTAPSRRWVDIPALGAFYRLPDPDRQQARAAWMKALLLADPGLGHDRAGALAIPLLRTTLAHNAKAAFTVKPVPRGTPPVDAGGVVHGVTLPTLRLPLLEPDCYLPVIGHVEGALESINAWDAQAGVSLGVIQFNADRAALFRFLWQLWTTDPDLFAATLTESLDWTMVWDDDHPDLLVGADRLHGRSADRARNVSYLQTGTIGASGRNGPFRRKVAAALRNCVVWPHVQDMIVDTSAWYLQAALKDIRAEGIGPLDVAAPDHDTFILTAMLLSARVRYSGCLGRLLAQLRQWPGATQKLAHWQPALAATVDPCPSLLPRLQSQQEVAESVYRQVLRLLG